MVEKIGVMECWSDVGGCCLGLPLSIGGTGLLGTMGWTPSLQYSSTPLLCFRDRSLCLIGLYEARQHRIRRKILLGMLKKSTS